ncbi:MAG: hypothetical protein ACXVEF_21840 [Polyangiales bacterium]
MTSCTVVTVLVRSPAGITLNVAWKSDTPRRSNVKGMPHMVTGPVGSYG